MAKWVEYTGSDEQIAEIKKAKSYAIRGIDVAEICSQYVLGPYMWFDTSRHPDPRLRSRNNLKEELECSNVTHYLICEPHPYADIIKIWAETGCEVWVKEGKSHRQPFIYVTDKPNWNIPGAEYRLTSF